MDDESIPKRKLSDYTATFRALREAGFDGILVAGHAASLWGETYQNRSRELERMLPFLSKDIDILCSIDDLAKAATVIPDLKRIPFRRDLGLLAVAYADGDKRIDFIRDLNGVMADAIRDRTVVLKYDGEPIRVIDPITLFAAKAANVASLDQERRNDVRQLQALFHVLPCHLLDAVSLARVRKTRERTVIKLYRYLLDILKRPATRKGCRIAGIEIGKLFPTEGLEDLPKLHRYITRTLPRELEASRTDISMPEL